VGATGCIDCPIGAHCGGAAGASSFTLCPAGTFIESAASRLGVCEECKTGKISDAEGSSSCTACSWTEYASDAKNECKFCLDPAIGLGFQRPSECLVIWAIIGGLLAICACCACQAKATASWCGNKEEDGAISVSDLTTHTKQERGERPPSMDYTGASKGEEIELQQEGNVTTGFAAARDRKRSVEHSAAASPPVPVNRNRKKKKVVAKNAEFVHDEPEPTRNPSFSSKTSLKKRKKRGPKDLQNYTVIDSPVNSRAVDVNDIEVVDAIDHEPAAAAHSSGLPPRTGGLPKVSRPPEAPVETQSLLTGGDGVQQNQYLMYEDPVSGGSSIPNNMTHVDSAKSESTLQWEFEHTSSFS